MATPNDIEDAMATVRRWVLDSNISNVALARLAGVDEKTIRLAARPGWNPTAETLTKLLAAAMAVS